MARAKNARRVLLGDLRTLNRTMRYWTTMFDQTGKVYTGQRVDPIRARRPDEYIENDPVLLRAFARSAYEISDALRAMARFAERRAEHVETRK